jgi:hypothetical protein
MFNRRLMILAFLVTFVVFACNFIQETVSDQEPLETPLSDNQTPQASREYQPTMIPPSQEPGARVTATLAPEPRLRIVYTDKGNIWMIEGTKPPQQLTSSGYAENVLISTDGTKITFTRRPVSDEVAELRSVNADGTAETVLLSQDDMKALYPSSLESMGFEIWQMAFLPGSHALYFNTFEAFKTVGLAISNDLFRINADTGDLTKVLPSGNGGNFIISPDGNHIVVVRPDTIDLVGPGGGGLVANVVSYLPVMTYSEFQYYAQPVWASDGSAVGVAIPNDDPLGPNPNGFIWRFNNTGSSSIKIATIPGDFYFSQVFSNSTMSPSLNRVAFLRDTATPNIQDLFLANTDGTGETLYTTGNIDWVGWAPDGIHFVYSVGDPMNLQLGTDGAADIPLVTGIDLRWINDSRFIYLNGSIGAWTLMIGNLGGVSTSLANPSGDFISYDFAR